MDPLMLGFRFEVWIQTPGVKSQDIDLRFQKVNGLSAKLRTTGISEGGQNLYTQQLPMGAEHDNLVLERGMVVRSPLNEVFDDALMRFKFKQSRVLVTLYGESRRDPIAAWTFFEAYPVRWSTSDLNASEKNLLIDTLELAYTRMQREQI